MAAYYKVTKECYFGGVLRTPENSHNVVHVEKKFTKKEQPSYLEFVGDESDAPETDDDVVEVPDTTG